MLKCYLTLKKDPSFPAPILINSAAQCIPSVPQPVLGFLETELTKFLLRLHGNDLSSQKLTPKDIPKWLPLLPCVHFHPCGRTPPKKGLFSTGETDSETFLHRYVFSNFQDGSSIRKTASIFEESTVKF